MMSPVLFDSGTFTFRPAVSVLGLTAGGVPWGRDGWEFALRTVSETSSHSPLRRKSSVTLHLGVLPL